MNPAPDAAIGLASYEQHLRNGQIHSYTQGLFSRMDKAQNFLIINSANAGLSQYYFLITTQSSFNFFPISMSSSTTVKVFLPLVLLTEAG